MNCKPIFKLLSIFVIFNLYSCASEEAQNAGDNTDALQELSTEDAGKVDVNKLLETFKNPKETTDNRVNAGMSFLEVKDPRILPVLLEVIEKDKDEQVVNTAIAAIKYADKDKAVEALDTVLKSDRKAFLKSFAINHLAMLDTEKTVPMLMQALKDKEGSVRISAFRNLGNIQDKQALPALQEALKNEKNEKVRDFAQGVVAKFK